MNKYSFAHVGSTLVLAAALLSGGCSSESSSPASFDTPAAGTATWSIRTLDSTGVVGEEAHIAVDSAGHVAVSYFNSTTGMIRCARLVGSSWTFADVGSSAGPYVTTGRNSIDLKGDGSPVVLYHKTDDAYCVTSWTGAAWTAPAVIGWSESAWAFLGRNAVAVNKTTSTIHAGLALYDSRNGSVMGYWQSPNASAVALDGPALGSTGRSMAIAVDGSGTVHVAYEYEATSTSTAILKYARLSGGIWSVATVDSIGDNGNFTSSLISLAVGPDGSPHIAYYAHFVGYKYAHWNGSTWEKSLVQAYASMGWCDQSIAVDKNGAPHIALLMGSYRLLYATRSAGSWTIETVDAHTGFGPAIGVNGSGTIYIAYYDDNDNVLKLAVRTP
jgi:hypothetical protein